MANRSKRRVPSLAGKTTPERLASIEAILSPLPDAINNLAEALAGALATLVQKQDHDALANRVHQLEMNAAGQGGAAAIRAANAGSAERWLQTLTPYFLGVAGMVGALIVKGGL